jgi:hypothetical protein
VNFHEETPTMVNKILSLGPRAVTGRVSVGGRLLWLAAVVAAGAALGLIGVGSAHGQSSITTWTGLGSDANFSTVGNWSTNAVPVTGTGSVLVFSGTASGHTLNKDLATS